MRNIFLAFIFISEMLWSQGDAKEDKPVDYAHVDRTVLTYPPRISEPGKLADLINRDFALAEDKARAIYDWIAWNIEYDTGNRNPSGKGTVITYTTEEEKREKEQSLKLDLAVQTLRDRKAVCQGYATLFQILCDMTSVQCEIVNGFVKIEESDIGALPDQENHTWNAVNLDGAWKLIDVTWGAGYLDSKGRQFIKDFTDFYFLSDPELFYLKHYPSDQEWLQVKHSEREFANLPLYYRAYFDSRVEIIDPRDDGIIRLPRDKMIRIVLRNSEDEDLTFMFNKERQSQKVNPQAKNDLYYYEIKAGSGNYMTIYLNGRSMVTYKID